MTNYATHHTPPAAPCATQARSQLNYFLFTFFGRALTLGFGAIILGLIDKQLALSDFPFTQLAVIYLFWLAALATATFGTNLLARFLWVLLLNASSQIYQLAIYPQIDEPILRIGPFILAAFILFLSCIGYRSTHGGKYLFWICLNIPSLVGSLSNSLIPISDVCVFFFFNVVFPLFIVHASDCLNRREEFGLTWAAGLSLTVLVSAAIPIMLAPLELHYRDTLSLAMLEYSRSYAVLGGIVLVWPILASTLASWSILPRVLGLSTVILPFIISFSRGAAFFGTLLFLGTLGFSFRSRSRIFLGVILSAATISLFTVFFMWDWVSELGWYWLLRLNIADNEVVALNFDFRESLRSGREEIWGMGVISFFANPFCGTGIGSTPKVIGILSSGDFTFSGFHSLFLTVLVERGLFGLAGVLALTGRIVWLIYRIPLSHNSRNFFLFSFGCFLFFANTTGIEMFLNSTRAINVDITLYLLLLLAYFERIKRAFSP